MILQEKDIKVGTQVIFKERIYQEEKDCSRHQIGEDTYNCIEYRAHGAFHDKPCVFTCVNIEDNLTLRPVDLFADSSIKIEGSFINLQKQIKKYRNTSGEWTNCDGGTDCEKSGLSRHPIHNGGADTEDDRVNHPSHYTWLRELCGIEVIDITRHMDFDIGNCIKYILRAGHKSECGYSNKQKALEDFKKAAWYLDDKIRALENEI